MLVSTPLCIRCFGHVDQSPHIPDLLLQCRRHLRICTDVCYAALAGRWRVKFVSWIAAPSSRSGRPTPYFLPGCRCDGAGFDRLVRDRTHQGSYHQADRDHSCKMTAGVGGSRIGSAKTHLHIRPPSAGQWVLLVLATCLYLPYREYE